MGNELVSSSPIFINTSIIRDMAQPSSTSKKGETGANCPGCGQETSLCTLATQYSFPRLCELSVEQLTSGDNFGCQVCKVINCALELFHFPEQGLERKCDVRGPQVAIQFKAQAEDNPDAIWAPLVVLEFYRLPGKFAS